MGDLFPTYKASVYDKDNDELDWTHLNTIQWMGDNEILVSSRETSTIVKITDIYGTPEIAYMMGEKTYWEDSDLSLIHIYLFLLLLYSFIIRRL